MAIKVVSRSPGSLILEIVVAILIAILLLAILIPRKQWKEQLREENICRQRMENIYFASRLYHQITRGYTADPNELLTFAESESIEVYPPGFKMDRLTREDSGIDSFQVEYYDPYQLFSHFEKAIHIDSTKKDSVILTIKPKVEYPFAPLTQYIFTSDVPITAVNDDRGDQGIFTMVGAQGRLRGTQIIGEKTSVPAAQYIYNIDRADMIKCPTIQMEYKAWVNVKLTIEAVMRAVIHREPPETSLVSSHRLSSIVVFRMLKEADAKAQRSLLAEKTFETVEDSLIQGNNQAFLDSCSKSLKSEGLDDLSLAIYDSTLENSYLEDETREARWEKIRDASYQYMNTLKEDSAFIALRDRIVNNRKEILINDNFQAHIRKLRSEGTISVVEVGFINSTADSIEFYKNAELIRNRLFKAHGDPITKARLSDPEVIDLLEHFSFTESYEVTKVDSTGITIKCPIEGESVKPDLSLLNRIFKVKGSKNHGNVEKGDLSWSEKR